MKTRVRIVKGRWSGKSGTINGELHNGLAIYTKAVVAIPDNEWPNDMVILARSSLREIESELQLGDVIAREG